MAPETPGKVRVSKIVRVSSPTHFEFGKNIAIVNRQHGLGGLVNIRSPALRKGRIGSPIEGPYSLRYAGRRLLAAFVFRLEHFSALFLNKRQRHRNAAELHLAV